MREAFPTSERIKAARIQVGLTQKDLAERIGTTPQNISQYERGIRTPKYSTLIRISEALGIPPHALIDDPDYYYRYDEDYKKNINLSKLVETISKVVFPSQDKSLAEELAQKVIHNMELDSYNTSLQHNISEHERIKQLLLLHFEKLNTEGKAVAVQRVEELTEIPKYQREPENSAKKEPPPAANRKRPTEE